MSEKPRPNAENTAARPGISTREIPAASATLQTTNGPPPPNAASVVSDEMFANLVSASATLATQARSEEHTSELQSLMRISYAVFCLKKKKKQTEINTTNTHN